MTKEHGVGAEGESLRYLAETLMEIRSGMVVAVVELERTKSKERLWQCLDRLDGLLDDMLPSLDPEWGITDYVEQRGPPPNIPYSPTEWTDPEPPPPSREPRRRDW